MKRQQGQAMLEALALATALTLALLLPAGSDRSIATVLLQAIAGFLQAQSFVLSIV